MEVVLIDAFVVPEGSRAAFLTQAQKAQAVVKTMAGYVEGAIYEETGTDSPYNVITVAVWESEAAFEQAKIEVPRIYEQQGINPKAALDELDVQLIRATYTRVAS
jgi:multidrug efflux pump subunit AcrA (membrane-fusion protein)